MRRLALVALAALAAYVVWRALVDLGLAGASAPEGGDAPPPPDLPADAPASPAVVAATPPADVAGDVADDEDDYLLHNRGGGDWQDHREQYQAQWYRQLWQPAARVPLSSLQARDFKLAGRLVSLALDRLGEPQGDRYRDLVHDKERAESSALVTSILSKIAAVVPVVGTALAEVAASQTQDLNSAALGIVQQANLVKSLRSAFDPANLDAASLMWLSNPVHRGEAVADAHVLYANDLQLAPIDPDGGVWRDRPGLITANALLGYEPGPYELARFYVHQRFFTLCPSGYVLPWLAYELGMRDGLRTRVNLRARVLRCLDLMCALTDPALPGGDAYLWCYDNSVYGAVLGSVFPPVGLEDRRHVDAAGVTWDYHGKVYRPGTPTEQAAEARVTRGARAVNT